METCSRVKSHYLSPGYLNGVKKSPQRIDDYQLSDGG